ncbi:hypothetical protein BJX63DRAFT_412802 [Aspergillus granulosus]|uniref:Ankyrin repeat protein n=1 Tax=Aspergillus granulosus TaxID=176169 RepID=A0ABR4GVW8_9EURO
MTALHLAAEDGNLDATRLLLQYGADFHIAEHGSTAEKLAISKGHTEVAKLLQGWKHKKSSILRR